MSGFSIKRRRGTTAQHASFVGLIGELTVDTDKNVIVVHDGATSGGHETADAGLTNVDYQLSSLLVLECLLLTILAY